MNRQERINYLEKKLRTEKNTFADEILKQKGEKFYEGETGYVDNQRFLVWEDMPRDQLPKRLDQMRKILFSMRRKNPKTLSNINDDTKFPIYQFLEQLQEPSDKYFEDGDNFFSVVEYLTTKYDKEFPCEENGFDEDVCYEGGDIHLSVKKESVRALQNAFTNRGLSDTNLKNQDYESISQTMTESRYNYLTELAEIFQKNPEADEIIDFVTEDLPSNTWFNHTIHLPCDDPKEFEKLEMKYVKP